MRVIHAILSLALPVVVAPFAAAAEAPPSRIDRLRERLAPLKQTIDRLPKARRAILSSAAQNILGLSERREVLERGGEAEGETGLRLSERGADSDRRLPSPRVSDPRADLVSTYLVGFTQSETSTAWCGRTIVVGFNDSGSILETPETVGVSFMGIARSTDGGRTFVDTGALNPGAVQNFLAGDPVVVCADERTFYAASIFSPDPNQSGISVSASHDGGAHFDAPVPAVVEQSGVVDVDPETFEIHFLDKPWLAIDSRHPTRLYLTYTDFEFSVNGACPSQARAAIELSRSNDGGLTWSRPVTVDEVCGEAALQGSQVAVGPDGSVNVLWEEFADLRGGGREMRFRRSVDGGASFEPVVRIDAVSPIGGGSWLKAGARSGFEFPSLAIDRSNGPARGLLYAAWSDARAGATRPDLFSPSGTYAYGDIVVSTSADNGATWSTPVQANPVDGSSPSDQYQPALAVDAAGALGLCYYDRDGDPQDVFVRRSCRLSENRGASWRAREGWEGRWFPFRGVDDLVNPTYVGDYDTLAVDALGRFRGFRGAFSAASSRGNPDVFFTAFRNESGRR